MTTPSHAAVDLCEQFTQLGIPSDALSIGHDGKVRLDVPAGWLCTIADMVNSDEVDVRVTLTTREDYAQVSTQLQKIRPSENGRDDYLREALSMHPSHEVIG